MGDLYAISQISKVSCDDGIQPRRLDSLLFQLTQEPFHLFLKWLAVVLLCPGTHVAAWRQHVHIFPDFIKRGTLAKARNIRVLASLMLATPSVVGFSDMCYFL